MEQAPEQGEAAWLAALETLRGAYADRTLDNCASVFRCFQAWCREHGLQALPARPETLAAYVDELFGRLAASTLRTRLNELRRLHRATGHPDPTRHPVVMLAYRRGLRTFGSAVRQAAGLNAPLRDRLLAACTPDLIGLRDRLMIRMGYDTLCRSIELVALRFEDIVPLPEGGASILVRRAKMDPGALGQLAYLSVETLELLRAWEAATDLSEGPIFRPVQGGRVFARQSDRQIVSLRLRLVARRAGLAEQEVRRLTSHSMRVGAAQDLASQGRTLIEIMRAGRWRFVESVTDYTKHAPVNVWAAGDGDVYALHRDVQARIRRSAAHQLRSADGHEDGVEGW